MAGTRLASSRCIVALIAFCPILSNRFSFIREFGTYSLMIFVGLLGIVGCFYYRLWR